MKETFKKVFSDIVKEKVETMNFNHYKYANEKNSYREELEQILQINKVGKNTDLNVICKTFCIWLYLFEK